MLNATLKGLLAHKLRLGMSAFAIILGVAFVAGTFVFTDTLNRSFTDLFRQTAPDVTVRPVDTASDSGGFTGSDARTVPPSARRARRPARGGPGRRQCHRPEHLHRRPRRQGVEVAKCKRGAPLEIRPLTRLESIAAGSVTARHDRLSGAIHEVAADVLVVVGERCSRAWDGLVPPGPSVQVIGDAIVPRRVQHAIAEGRAAARRV